MNSNFPFFSVVITSYNRENLIEETLNTVFNQTYKNFEIIIVDDASTDNTVSILKPLEKEGRIKLIVNRENSERCISRNIGMEAAKGDYVTLLDSDDFMYPDCLADAAEFVRKNNGVHFFHNYYELVDNNRNVVYKYSFPKKEDFTKKMAEGNFISCIGNFISKEIYTNYKFSVDPKVLGSEDWEIWLRVYSSYELGVIPKVNHGVRNHDSRSVNSLDYARIIETKLYIVRNLFENRQFEDKFGPYKEFMLGSIYLFAAVGANKYFEFKKARQYIAKAIREYPKIILTERFLRVSLNALLQIKKAY